MVDIGFSGIVPFIMFGMLIGLCGFFEPSHNNNNVLIDNSYEQIHCYDDTCLKEQFIICEPSYGNINNQIFTAYVEINGETSNGKCEVYVRLDDLNSSAIPESYKMFTSFAVGSDMVCEVEDNEKNLLIEGKFDKNLISKCNGNLANILDMIAPYIE